MDESLQVDFAQFEKLLSQVTPGPSATARAIASEWMIPGAMKE
jgi:chromate transport protein ChrA